MSTTKLIKEKRRRRKIERRKKERRKRRGRKTVVNAEENIFLLYINSLF